MLGAVALPQVWLGCPVLAGPRTVVLVVTPVVALASRDVVGEAAAAALGDGEGGAAAPGGPAKAEPHANTAAAIATDWGRRFMIDLSHKAFGPPSCPPMQQST